MEADIYLPDEIYYALIDALDRLRPDAGAENDGGSTVKMVLAEVAGIFPAWIAEECQPT